MMLWSSARGVGPLSWIRERLSARNNPPPPSPLRPLGPDPIGKWAPRMAGHPPRLVLPPSPRKPAPLARAQERAARLQLPGPPRLQRPELHRDHDHQELERAWNYATLYLHNDGPPLPPLPEPAVSRWTRYVLQYQLEERERRTPDHKWHKLWRINDMRDLFGIERRDQSGGGPLDS